MELSQATVQLLVVVVPLVNGLITAMVALAATALAHRYTEKRENRKQDAERKSVRAALLREKLETLVELVEEHYHGCGVDAMNIGHQLVAWNAGEKVPINTLKEGVDPLDRASALQVLYFPELETRIAAVRQATGAHITFLAEEIDVASSEGGLEIWNNTRQATFAARSVDARAPIYRATLGLGREARALMESLLTQ